MTSPSKSPASTPAQSTERSGALPHPAPEGVTIYYWPCSLVLLARSLILDRPTGPLSATLRIACSEPYTIEVEGRTLVTRASLVAPKAERKKILALNSDIALFYLPLDIPEYAGLRSVLDGRPVVDLAIEDFEPFLPTIKQAMTQILPPETIKTLVRQLVETITGKAAPDIGKVDPRIAAACRILDEMPLSNVSLNEVARQVHLSSSRLRELFRVQTGFTIGEYARWRAVWRAALLWKRGMKLTDVAAEAGFHDLAHLDRVFNQVFGMNPSSVIDPHYVTLVNCE